MWDIMRGEFRDQDRESAALRVSIYLADGRIG